MGSSPFPTPTPSSPTYVPSFPFYDAEPYWPKGGYGHHGGEEGSDSAATTDFYFFVKSFDTAAPQLAIENLSYDRDQDEIETSSTHLEYEPMTVENQIDGETITSYCYRYKDCPVGARIVNGFRDVPLLSHSPYLIPFDMTFNGTDTMVSGTDTMVYVYCPRPQDDFYIIGQAAKEKTIG